MCGGFSCFNFISCGRKPRCGWVHVWPYPETGWMVELRYIQGRRREIPKVLHQWKNHCLLPTEIVLIPLSVFIFHFHLFVNPSSESCLSHFYHLCIVCTILFQLHFHEERLQLWFPCILWRKHQLNVCHCFPMQFSFQLSCKF